MSYLSCKVRDYVNQPGITALGLEKQAGVPSTTINNILRESHPRPERLGQLLRVLPGSIATEWLIAYLKDDIPPDWLPRVQILVEALETAQDRVAEVPATYGPAATARALERLQQGLETDPTLGDWLVKTINLIYGPE